MNSTLDTRKIRGENLSRFLILHVTICRKIRSLENIQIRTGKMFWTENELAKERGDRRCVFQNRNKNDPICAEQRCMIVRIFDSSSSFIWRTHEKKKEETALFSHCTPRMHSVRGQGHPDHLRCYYGVCMKKQAVKKKGIAMHWSPHAILQCMEMFLCEK